ncbi:MAG: bifunctional pyr operon transcriptional regulator/uracil phosphoribosyltransferase PyrR [Candidatus Hydrogenedentota bacterium]
MSDIRKDRQYTVLRDGTAMRAMMRTMAQEIVQDNPQIDALVLLGIVTRGVPLADRLAMLIHEMTDYYPPVGSLGTTLYRDDLHARTGEFKVGGETHFDFDVDGKTVLLVDDVVAAGRTIRAAMDEVMDYGRPRRVQLACLVDRGGRELPVQPDYLGFEVATSRHDWVLVRLQEIDGEDAVLEERREPPAGADEHEGA